MTGNKLSIQVPSTRSAWYLIGVRVAGEDALDLATRWIDRYEPRWVGERLQALAGTSALSVASVEASSLCLTPHQRELVGETGTWISVRVELPTGPGLEHEWLARRLAYPMADEFRIEALDMVSGTKVTADMLQSSLHTKEEGAVRLADWVAVEFRDPAERGLTVSTSGLRRYGLPELTAGRVPLRLARRWGVILTALAFLVYEQFAESLHTAMKFSPWPWPPEGWTAPTSFDLPDEIEVLADEVRAAYCLPGGFASRNWGWRYRREASVRDLARLFPSAGNVLRVLPPRDWDGQEGEFTESFFADESRLAVIAEAVPFAREYQEAWRPETARYDWQYLVRDDSLVMA